MLALLGVAALSSTATAHASPAAPPVPALAAAAASPAASSTPLAVVPLTGLSGPQLASSAGLPGRAVDSSERAGLVTAAVVAGRTVTLGPKATKRILAALATGGSGLAVIACQAAVPADMKPYCALIVSTLAGLVALGDAGSRCLQITVGFGVPPVRTALVPCPPGPADPEPIVPGLVVPVPVVAGLQTTGLRTAGAGALAT